MKRDAYITPDGVYRYLLTRDWSEEQEVLKTVTFVGLNPSTADAIHDDPTIKRCIAFSKAWGFNRLFMVNLFAYRATNPSDMKKAPDPEGEFNPSIVWSASDAADITVAVWGVHGAFKEQGKRYLTGLKNLHHLGLTKDGFPKHPLYLRADVKPTLMVKQ